MIAIVAPAYNEEESIGGVLKDIKVVMDKTKHKYEILVIDDGSSDKTAEIAKKTGAIVFSHPANYGLAESFRTGISKALERKADLIVHIDTDGQYSPSEIPKLIKPVTDGKADLVLGSRFLGTIEHMPLMKRCGNRAFSRVISKITKMKVTDGQTGFRAFTREVGEKVKIKSMHTYTQEMIIRAAKMKFRIAEVPVYFARRKSGKSRLVSHPLGYAFNAWINILRVYRDFEALKFFGSIGTLFMLIGFLTGLFVVSQIFISGWPTIDRMIPTVMLAVLFLISGVQILLFGFLADKDSQ